MLTLTRSSAQFRAFLFLFSGAGFIGIAPILVRLSETGPVASGFWRMFLAFSMMMAWWQWDRYRHPKDARGIHSPTMTATNASSPKLSPVRKAWLFFGVAFFFAGDLSTWHVSLQYTTVTNSLLIVNSTVFVVALGAWWIYGERPTRSLIIGAMVGFFGVGLLILGSQWLSKGATLAESAIIGAKYKVGESTLFGDLLSLVANLFYAGYLLQLRFARQWYSAVDIMRISNGLCAILLLIIALVLRENILPHSAYGWGVIITLALVCQVLGQTLIARGIEGLPLGFSSMILLMQPVVGALASAVVLNEMIQLTHLIGGGLVFLGIYLARPASPSKSTP